MGRRGWEHSGQRKQEASLSCCRVPGRTTVWPQHGPCVSGPHRSEGGAPTWEARPQEGGGKGGDVEGRSGYSSLLLIRL